MKYYRSLIEKTRFSIHSADGNHIVHLGWVHHLGRYETPDRVVESSSASRPPARMCILHGHVVHYDIWQVAHNCVEALPLMTMMARRYGVMHGIAAQAELKICFLACL